MRCLCGPPGKVSLLYAAIHAVLSFWCGLPNSRLMLHITYIARINPALDRSLCRSLVVGRRATCEEHQLTQFRGELEQVKGVTRHSEW